MASPSSARSSTLIGISSSLAACLVGGVLVWQALVAHGNPAARASATAVVDIGVLVFREGLESVLVLAAIMATMVGDAGSYRRPVALGAGLGLLASLLTWKVAVGIVDSLTASLSALQLQALTGLLAVVVLLLVMNWFFHKIYWTGWISTHTARRKTLLRRASDPGRPRAPVFTGLALLGFTSLYREGFEIVLFLQNYRLRLGTEPVLHGVLIGGTLTAVVAVLTFVAHRRLPYKRMLVLTGVLLGIVLMVMVGEQAQEMQLAHWLPTTEIPWLVGEIPGWLKLWFSVFPTVETLTAQAVTAALVLGSYVVVRRQIERTVRASRATG